MRKKLFGSTLTVGFAAVVAGSLGCAGATIHELPGPAGDGAENRGAETVGLAPAQVAWWESLRVLCGQAYSGALAHGDPADDAFAGRPMTMHVRRCEEGRVEIPFHVGEDRSRTWVVRRTETGIELKHDHRHEDGGEDAVTGYGGHTEGAGTEVVQLFPADEHSRALFEEHGIPQSAANVWSLEIVPGVRFSYVLRRPGRHFQVDFDLSEPVPPPPPPWGPEPRGRAVPPGAPTMRREPGTQDLSALPARLEAIGLACRDGTGTPAERGKRRSVDVLVGSLPPSGSPTSRTSGRRRRTC